MRHLFFGVSLLATFLNGPWLWVAQLAWVALAVLFTLDFRYAVYALFFFCSSFHPSGFFSNCSFFTLKHLHIAILLTVLIQIFRGNFISSFKMSLKYSRFWRLLFVWGGLALGIALWNGSAKKTFFLTANFFSVLLIFSYLAGLLSQHKNLLKPGLLFFLSGLSFQSLIAFSNFYTGRYWLRMTLIHNNQLGVLSAISLFYSFAFIFSEKKLFLKIFSGVITLILFLNLIFSCSRTAWIGFALGYLFWIFARVFYSRRQVWRPRFRFILTAVVLWFVFQWIAPMNYDIRTRAGEVTGLRAASAWHYTFFIDHKNFGFLGSYRRVQLKRAVQIIKTHFLFGQGLTHEITDFHSLYLTILAGTGLIGFVLFCSFLFLFFRDMHRSLLVPEDRDFIFKLSAFAAVMTWSLVSALENRLLQYPVWANLFIAHLWMIRSPRVAGKKEEVSQQNIA